jgi:integral membrane protein (TIGR00529 family)
VAIIQCFNEILGTTGRLEILVDSLKRITEKAFLRLAFFPVLIGLLPVPGGAVFSAPMVKETAREQALEPHHLALVNYWFRHVFEYTWPLYPSLIVLSGISGYSLGHLSVLFIPAALMSLFCGWFFLIRSVENRLTECGEPHEQTSDLKPLSQFQERGQNRSPYNSFLRAIWPLALMISLFFIQSRFMSPLIPIKYSEMICALLTVIFIQFFLDVHNTVQGMKRAFSKSGFYSMLLSIVSIMYFKSVIESGAAPVLASVFSSRAGAVFFITSLLPFLSGLALGYGPGVVGSSFPIVYSFVLHSFPEKLSGFIFLSFCSGFMGVLLSPAHLCLTVSKEFFEASTFDFYRLLFKMVAILFLLISLYFLLMYRLL